MFVVLKWFKVLEGVFYNVFCGTKNIILGELTIFLKMTLKNNLEKFYEIKIKFSSEI